MALLLCVLRMAHVVSAFAPRGGPTASSLCLGKQCQRVSYHQVESRRGPQIPMSVDNIGFEDTTGEVVFNDVDGIGETLLQNESSDSMSVTEDGTQGVAGGTAVLEKESLDLAAVSGPVDSIAQQIVASALLEDDPTKAPVLVGRGSGSGTSDVSDISSPSSHKSEGRPAQDDREMIDAAAVVAAVMDASLSDPDSNGVLPSPNLLPDSVKEDLMSGINIGTTKELQVNEKEESLEAPSLSKILKFAIPAIGVWLCGPILSLIDTSSVGLLSGTAQQAALNPAVAVTDYAALLMAFMYTATTNLVATAQEKEKGSSEKPLTTKTLITSLQLSGIFGAVLGAFLISCSRLLLRAIIGNDNIDPEVFSAAMKYVQIRALGMPAAAVIGSAQSASLGMQDIKSPLYVLMAAAIVNFFGDVIFVGQSNPLFGGAAGAAWATVFSQYAALAMFLKWFSSKPQNKRERKSTQDATSDGASAKVEKIDLTKAIMELTGEGEEGASRRNSYRNSLRRLCKSPKSGPKINLRKGNLLFRHKSGKDKKEEKASSSFTTRGFLHGHFSERDILKVPDKKIAEKFLPYVIPVTTTSVGRVSSYIAMSHVVSSVLGTVSMAANQVILSLFYCLTPIADSLSLTAQSFVPAIFEKRKLRNGAVALKKTVANFVKAGGLFGAAMAGAVACIPLFSKFFTSDAVVISQVNSAVPFLAVIFAVHGVICAIEGLLLGQKDLGFLGKAYGACFGAVPYFMLRVKKAALSGTRNVDLSSVWQVFMGYQIVRFCLWVLRAMQLQKRTEQEVMGA